MTLPGGWLLSTAASRFSLRLGTGGRGQKLLPTMVAAKVERLSIAFGAESGCFVYGHSTDGIFSYGFRFFHERVSFLVVVVTSQAGHARTTISWTACLLQRSAVP